MASKEAFPPRTDLYRVSVSGGPSTRLTSDHHSLDPLWGPGNTIVFVKLLGAKQRRYGPKNELFLIGPEGGQARRLTHTYVGPLLQGLVPTQWSADGSRLLAQFNGQDTTYAVTVNPQTGAQRSLVEATEQGLVGTALSADGSVVLGASGGFEPGPGHDVVSIPYGGGRQTILAKNAFEPDWSC
ncbi:MAG: TolB family protein [Mycobacteriales bacterium]